MDTSNTMTDQWVQLMKCPYSEICTDKDTKCSSCRHSPKRSYYEPVDTYRIIPWPYPITPTVPWYPTYPYYTVTCGDTTPHTENTQSYYLEMN